MAYDEKMFKTLLRGFMFLMVKENTLKYFPEMKEDEIKCMEDMLREILWPNPEE